MTDEDKQKLEDAAYAAFRYGLMGDTPVAPPPHWRERLFPIGHPLNKTVLREEFKALREMVYGPVMPIEERKHLGPPPSDPRDRLYEHLKQRASQVLVERLRNTYPGQSKNEGEQ
jgi:hypothetical protein